MKIQELFRRTDAQRRMLAKYVRIVATKTGYREGLGFVAAKTQSTHRIGRGGFLEPVRPQDRNTYVTVITFKDEKLNVIVSCSCPDHMFRTETALYHGKAAEIIYSNGEWPVITNPDGQMYLCKHLCALYLKYASKIPKTK